MASLTNESHESKASHTPGPWITQCPSFQGWGVYKTGDFTKPICTVYSRTEDYGSDGGRFYDTECKANAWLIAAAPALLAALEGLLQRVEECYDVDGHPADLCEQARAAIASALPNGPPPELSESPGCGDAYWAREGGPA